MNFLTLFLITLPLALTLECLRGTLNPLLEDCEQLIDMLLVESLSPEGRTVKRWGRGEEESPTTRKLPKNYYIIRPGQKQQSTCILRLIAWERPGVPEYDDFSLQRVASSARGIMSTCVARGSPGWDFLGVNHVVMAAVEWFRRPWLEVGPSQNVTTIISNGTVELRSYDPVTENLEID